MKKQFKEDLEKHDFFTLNWLCEALGLTRSKTLNKCIKKDVKLISVPSGSGKRTSVFIIKKEEVEKLL